MSSSYQVPRCQHIKTNGTQCNSPAMRDYRRCYFHEHWAPEFIGLNTQKKPHPVGEIVLPVLEDASSIQSAICQVMSQLLQDRIDTKKAGLLLYALQTASANLGRLQAESHREMHCDPEITARTPLRNWTFEPWELEIMEKAAAAEAAKEEQRRENARLAALPPEPHPEAAEQSATADQKAREEQEEERRAEEKKKPETEPEPGLIAEIHAVTEEIQEDDELCTADIPVRRAVMGPPSLRPSNPEPLHAPQRRQGGIYRNESFLNDLPVLQRKSGPLRATAHPPRPSQAH